MMRRSIRNTTRSGTTLVFTPPEIRPTVICGDPIPGSRGLREFIADAPDTEPDVEIHGDDIAELQFTSGTTAMPKAVMLSHVNAYFAASGYALTLTRGVRCESDLRLCSFLPLVYHIGGQVFGSTGSYQLAFWLASGASVASLLLLFLARPPAEKPEPAHA